MQVEINKEFSIVHDTQLRTGTIDIQSIKKIDQILLREIICLNLDVTIVTETWLRDTDADQNWVQGCDFNKTPFQCHHANRHAKTGYI